jgi:hypothetical protein
VSSVIEQKIERLILECDKHHYRIESSFSKIQYKLPLTVKSYKALTDDDVEHIDQYLFRFSKLQDAIGQRFFKAILQFLQEDIEAMPFIDILNRLEKLRLVDSSEQWQRLREIRNAIAHEYNDSPELATQALNACFQSKEILFAIYQNLKTAYINTKKKW